MIKASLRVTVTAIVFSNILTAAYSDLVATRDGSAVFFKAKTGLRTWQSYRVTFEAGRPIVQDSARWLVDTSEDGSVLASTFFGDKYCGFAGSSCWLAADCRAELAIESPGFQIGRSRRRTFARLNRSGQKAWIEQSPDFCFDMAFPPSSQLNGLYEIPDLDLIATASDRTAANKRIGRRLITDRDRVLTLSAQGTLALVGTPEIRAIQTQFNVAEAVIDAGGLNIVYVSKPDGYLRWVDITRESEGNLDMFPTTGVAPAISDDGALLAFLTPEGRLQLYTRPLRTTETVDIRGETVQEFVLTANGAFVFATTGTGRLVRVDLATRAVETWLDPLPDIGATSTLASDRAGCLGICYGPFKPHLFLGPSSLVVLEGTNLDLPGWQVRLGDSGPLVPLQPLSGEAVWFQVPTSLGQDVGDGFQLVHPEHPLACSLPATYSERVLSCFGALHRDFSRIVTPSDPASVGEIVHIFLTGLQGVEPVPDGVPNPTDRLIPVDKPPPFALDSPLQPLFFGLAPGFIGLQQLDARIKHHDPAEPRPPMFAYGERTSGCQLPPTAP